MFAVEVQRLSYDAGTSVEELINTPRPRNIIIFKFADKMRNVVIWERMAGVEHDLDKSVNLDNIIVHCTILYCSWHVLIVRLNQLHSCLLKGYGGGTRWMVAVSFPGGVFVEETPSLSKQWALL